MNDLQQSVLEYREKRSRSEEKYSQAYIALAAAGIFGAMAIYMAESLVWLWGLMALMSTIVCWKQLAEYKAEKTDSKVRDGYERVYGEIPDPPLDEWEQYLEEQDAFKTPETNEFGELDMDSADPTEDTA